MEISNFDRRVLAIALGAGLLAVIGFALMLFDVWNGTKILTQVTVIAGIICVIAFRLLHFTKNDDE